MKEEQKLSVIHVPCGQLFSIEDLDSHDLHCPAEHPDERWHRFVTQEPEPAEEPDDRRR